MLDSLPEPLRLRLRRVQWQRVLVLACTLFVFGKTAFDLDAKTLWWDESLSLQRSGTGLERPSLSGKLVLKDGVSERTTWDQHPFAFYALLGILIRLAGGQRPGPAHHFGLCRHAAGTPPSGDLADSWNGRVWPRSVPDHGRQPWWRSIRWFCGTGRKRAPTRCGCCCRSCPCGHCRSGPRPGSGGTAGSHMANGGPWHGCWLRWPPWQPTSMPCCWCLSRRF